MKNIRAIRTEADYDWALAEIEQYFLGEPEPGSPSAERFDVLAALIEAYEARHWPIEPSDPIEAIRYKMEVAGLKQSDLAELLGSALLRDNQDENLASIRMRMRYYWRDGGRA